MAGATPPALHLASAGTPVGARFTAWTTKDPEAGVAVAAVRALLEVLQTSRASTLAQLAAELTDAARELERVATSFATKSGCSLFTRFVSNSMSEGGPKDFEAYKRLILSRGEGFVAMAAQSRTRIAQLGLRFVRDEEAMVILTHGFSRVVLAVLLHAAARGRRFTVLVTESRPECLGHNTARALQEAGIPARLILDAAMGHAMEKAELVLVGAEAVVENGGILNKIGTYQLAVMARALNRPFYVAAESFKFTRVYPLSQHDECLKVAAGNAATTERGVQSQPQPAPPATAPVGQVWERTPNIDYTPPAYISLLFTDLGVLTPSAVSDELIKLYKFYV